MNIKFYFYETNEKTEKSLIYCYYIIRRLIISKGSKKKKVLKCHDRIKGLRKV
jgi:hypothetical protein